MESRHTESSRWSLPKSDTDRDIHSDGYRDIHSNGHCDLNGDRYCNRDGGANTDAHSYAKSHPGSADV